MLRSLRFQLPALFLLGVVVAGLVSAAIALRLFREYAQNRSREQAYAEVGREANGLTQLYAQQAGLKLLSAKQLELATGDQIFYRGLDIFPGQGPAFTLLPKDVVDPRVVRARKKPLYFGFGNTPQGKALKAQFDAGFAKLKQSGELKKLFDANTKLRPDAFPH